MTNSIPVFRPPIPRAWQRELATVVESRWWGYGPRCHALEREFVQDGTGWALATNSCTAALYLVGRCLAGSTGGEVIVPALTFASTAVAFHEAGLRVRVADVDPTTLMLDVKSAAACITPLTRAIVAVHLFGQKQNLQSLRKLCDARNIRLVEDCAHRLNARTESTVADFACFSFNAVKEAPAGEGGMLWGRHITDEESCRAISYLGMKVDTVQRSSSMVHKPYAYSPQGGLKLRFSDLAAAFVHACTDELSGWHDTRRKIFARYDKAFTHLAPTVHLLTRNETTDSYLMYVVRVPDSRREQLRQGLAKCGIATSVHYPPLSKHPLFSTHSCGIAEQTACELITLPCFPELTVADQDRVIAGFLTAIEHGGK
jgi:dTDP-4-amino-4,6-dideoxygalactose transaminase